MEQQMSNKESCLKKIIELQPLGGWQDQKEKCDNEKKVSQVPPPEVVACFNAAGSRVKTRRHDSAGANHPDPLPEVVDFEIRK
jgi:hypothetical protein